MHSSEGSVDGQVDVPGASLRYRLAGVKSDLPTLVFENGWSASYHYWTWVQRELAPHAQLLFYNRAGIGGSTLTSPRTAASLSDQLEAMLVALNIRQPVVLVGQSYGGLMCALHAAQKPQRVRAFVQVDGTPDRDHPYVRKVLGVTKVVTRIIGVMTRLGLPDPIYGAAAKTLPGDEGEVMLRTSFGSPESMRHAFTELDQIDEFRAAIARATSMPPRLVITAGKASEPKGLLGRILASPKKARRVMEIMEEAHREQAAKNGRWMSLPHTHGGLVFEPAGAKATSAATLEFVRSLR
ncbi:MAG TPA: alpha/beta hydrolase [Nevskiaceae bacterium]|nr:alpha/beta hydrolase [Nevskiaceae bacterium]